MAVAPGKLWQKIWWWTLAVKIVLAYFIPFSHDEAYYWVWGRDPHLSYFDHPPMVGWLFFLGHIFDSLGNWSRLPGLLFSHLTSAVWLAILNLWVHQGYIKLKGRLSLWLGLLTCLQPTLFAPSFAITPDTPVMFFWSFTLFIVLQATARHKRWLKSPVFYILLGLSLGLGFSSKYHMVLFVPGLFGYLTLARLWRAVDWRYIPLTLFFGLFASSPVVAWNYMHEWASFKFQLSHGLGGQKWVESWTVEYLLGQLALLIPGIYFFVKLRRKFQLGRIFWAATVCFGWFPIGFFLFTSFKAPVEANWPFISHQMLWLSFFPFLSETVVRRATLTWAGLATLVISQALYPWLPIEEKRIKSYELRRTLPLIPIVREQSHIYVTSYQVASSLNYQIRDSKKFICKAPGMNRVDFYDFLKECKLLPKSFLLIYESHEEIDSMLARIGYRKTYTRQLPNDFMMTEVVTL